jgi:hypothetical protein
MKPSTKFVITTAVAGLLSSGLFAQGTTKTETKTETKTHTEKTVAGLGKCDGIKAGKTNDCATATHSCANQGKPGEMGWKKLTKKDCDTQKGSWSALPADAKKM